MERTVKMSKKRYITIAAIILATAVICILALRSFIGRNTLDKDQIIQFVLDNEDLLNQAVEEIWNLDGHIHVVAITRFRPRPGIDFESLYTSGTVGNQNVTEPLDSPILYELLRDGRIRSIGITRPDPTLGTTYQIQFDFNVRSAWDRYGGVYFSRNNVPILFDARRWTNPEVYGDGWVSYGRNFYYTERIVPQWFYYEMLFNSSREPQR